jgi:hypothetical protein
LATKEELYTARSDGWDAFRSVARAVARSDGWDAFRSVARAAAWFAWATASDAASYSYAADTARYARRAACNDSEKEKQIKIFKEYVK